MHGFLWGLNKKLLLNTAKKKIMAKANHRSNYPPGRQQQGNRRNDDQRNDLTLTAPYNFIPLHKQVVRPEWASLISHDVPLPDAQYGTLQLTIKAEQPIFTRNNVSRRVTNENEKKEKGSHFSKSPNNRYFLPGSSIKGAIRNLLEIMSYGDLSKGLNDEPWAMRDLNLENYKSAVLQGIHCGWLRKVGESEYVIQDCGVPHRITHQQIDEQLKTCNKNRRCKRKKKIVQCKERGFGRSKKLEK
jgi:hypothetical protein